MGGEERLERQRASGRMNVRERIDALLDDGTFHETGALAGQATYDADGELQEFRPSNMLVGSGRIDARRVVVEGDDFTVRGGAADATIWEKLVFAEKMAHELRLPLIRLIDGTGGGGSVKSLEDTGFSYVPPLPGFELLVANQAIVPVVGAALGPCAGLGAARIVASHFSVIVRGNAQMFVAGPPVVAAALNESTRQGGAGRRPRPHTRGRDRQRGRRRARRLRPDPPVPLLPAVERLGGAADRGRRPARPSRRGAAVDRPPRSARHLQDAPHPRARPRRGLGVRDRRPRRARADHRARAARRPPRRRHGVGPRPRGRR